MDKKRIAIIFGGRSSEHEVSLKSATNVINYIDTQKYEAHLLGITKEGRWLYYDGDVKNIADGSWQASENCRPAVITPDAKLQSIALLDDQKYIKIDAAFPVLHGRYGEDGTVQGLLSLAGIPCVGPGVAASAIAMDKVFAKIILDAEGITQAKWTWFNFRNYKDDLVAAALKCEKTLNYNMFVKPANAGSSVGVSKAKNRDELIKAFTLAAQYDDKIVIEEELFGQEVECAVLGNDELVVSGCGEILSANEFYDYDAKYLNDRSETLLHARISDEAVKKVKGVAKRVYAAIGCSGMSRIDFFVHEDEPYLLELNTIPGFTNISLYPMLMADAGVAPKELVTRLIDCAIDAQRAALALK